jgi:hypothetical protein
MTQTALVDPENQTEQPEHTEDMQPQEPSPEQPAEQESEEPAQPTMSLREQFTHDLQVATDAVSTAFMSVQRSGQTPEEMDASVRDYTAARLEQAGLESQEKELETKEKRASFCVQANKTIASLLKRMSIDDFEFHYYPIAEDGTGGATPTEPKAKRSASTSSNASGDNSGGRSTVRFIVDGITFTPPALMKQFGDEKLDNPKDSKAWENNKTHPKFYSSVYVRLLKEGKSVVVEIGDNPAASHDEFTGWTDYHKTRLGWNATGEKKSG